MPHKRPERKWYLDPGATNPLCPKCGSRARRGRVSGRFRFVPDLPELEAFLREIRRSELRGVIAPPSRDLEWRSSTGRSVWMEATVRYCRRCQWMDIDCASMRLRRPRGSEIAVNLPPEAEGAACPECRAELRGGYVGATLLFEAEGERLGPCRRWLRWWLGGTGARAWAACCNACGWIGIDCAGLVEPAPPAAFRRIEDR